MPTTQPIRRTSTRIHKRPTHGATLGSASKPPRWGSTTGPNFQAAQMATTQKTRDTASRTNPRSNPMMVEPNRTKSINTSAAVMYSQALRADSQALRHFQALRAEFNGVAATPFDRLCMNRIILPERYACRRETRVTNPKLACRRNQTRRLPGGLELRDRLGSGAAIRHGADAHSVPQRGPR